MPLVLWTKRYWRVVLLWLCLKAGRGLKRKWRERLTDNAYAIVTADNAIGLKRLADAIAAIRNRAVVCAVYSALVNQGMLGWGVAGNVRINHPGSHRHGKGLVAPVKCAVIGTGCIAARRRGLITLCKPRSDRMKGRPVRCCSPLNLHKSLWGPLKERFNEWVLWRELDTRETVKEMLEH